jgi:hypothetical protein
VAELLENIRPEMCFDNKNKCDLVVKMYHLMQNLYGVICSKVNLSFNTKLLNNNMFSGLPF